MGKGGGITSILGDVVDVATAIFAPEFLPLVAGAVGTGEGLLNHESFGKALGQGALSGLEAFGGQEIFGAAANAFPETAGSLGFTNTAGNSLTDILGTTSGAGSFAGPGTIGGDISNLFAGTSSSPISGASEILSSSGSSPGSFTSTPSGAPGSMTPPGGVGGSAITAGGGAGGSAASIAAPSSVGGTNPLDNLLNANQTPIPQGGLPSLSGSGDSVITGSPTAQTLIPQGGLPSLSGGAAEGFSSLLNQTPKPTSLPDLSGGTPSGGFGADTGLPSPSITDGLNSPVGGAVPLSSDTLGTNVASGVSNPDLAKNIASNEFASFNPGTPGGALSLGQPDTFSGFASGPGGANIPGATDSFGGAFTPATPSTGSNFLSHPGVGTFVDMLKANPSPVLGAAGLGFDALKQGQLVKGQKQLQQEAEQMAAQGGALQNYLQTGTLPPGVGAAINQAAEAQKATIRSRYAQAGSSGSSAEQQDLSAVDAWAQGQGAQTAMQLLTTGINESGLASSLYENIANTALQQDSALGSAIGNFASSLSGGGGGREVLLKIPGA